MYIFFHPQTFCLDIGSIMTYILVVWLDNSITSAPLTPTCVHYSLKSFVCYSIFGVPYHSVPHFIPPPYTLVPRFPVSRFPPLHFWRCRIFRSRIFSRPGVIPYGHTASSLVKSVCVSVVQLYHAFETMSEFAECLFLIIPQTTAA